MKRRALIALFTLTMTAAMIAGCGNSPNHNLTEENGQESPAEASEETDSHIEEAGEETTSDLERESGDETASGESEASNQAEPEADPDGAAPKEGTAASTEAGSQTADYTVTVMNAIMYAKNAVNLRQGPGTAYSKVGSLRKGDQVTVTGRADSGWYQLDSGAFVSDKYLDSKAPEATPADTTAPGMSADPATVLPVTIPASSLGL